MAAYIEQLGRIHARPTVKQHLAAIRMLFDGLATGHIMEAHQAHAVRGPKATYIVFLNQQVLAPLRPP